MTDTKMLQILVSGQASIRKEIKSLDLKLTKRIDKLDLKLTKRIDSLEKKVDKNGERIDKIGASVAFLEDDAPTRTEHDKLEERVTVVERSGLN